MVVRTPSSPPLSSPRHSSPYWRKTLRLSAGLLALWLLLTIVVTLFGRDLRFQLFGWPFGFWMTTQVALVVYCAIIWVYALVMDRIDQTHGDSVDD